MELKPISFLGGLKSISDDDLCSDCKHCELSGCTQDLPKVSKKTKEHPFFDYEVSCRKSAWDTPRHLSAADWLVAQGLLSASETGSAFLDYLLRLGPEEKEALFYRVLGHPEAKHYMKNHEWVLKSFYPGFVKHYRAKLRHACANQATVPKKP